MNEDEALSIWTDCTYSGCSEDEREDIALRYYLEDGFESLNQNLLGTRLSQKYSPQMREALFISADILSRKLRKLPDYRSELIEATLGDYDLACLPISRQHFPDPYLDQILKSSKLQVPYFVSANLEWEVKQHRPHRLIINSLRGKHVAGYSENRDTENEILFDRNTLFYLDDYDVYENEIWLYLTESDNENT